MKTLFLFIDGLGLGDNVPENPLFVNNYPGLERLTGGQKLTKVAEEFVGSEDGSEKTFETRPTKDGFALFRKVDACLGVDGLPQSGTGQATLFSGVNASEIIGKHFGPFPHSGNKHLLNKESLFNRLKALDKKPYFMNAFPEVFFERASKRNRWSCCTLMTKNAGIKLNSVEEVRDGKAVTAEILQDYWQKLLSIDVPEITTDNAAARVLNAFKKYDFIMMEYYLTDKAGHAQSSEEAHFALDRVDRFVASFLDQMYESKEEILLLITSDHGNVEDLNVKTHTFNDVPFIVRSNFTLSSEQVYKLDKVRDLTGVTPAILELYK